MGSIFGRLLIAHLLAVNESNNIDITKCSGENMKPEKKSSRVIRKKRLIIFVSVIFLFILVLIAWIIDKDAKTYTLNIDHPGPVINGELSEKEMSLPFSQYHRDYVEERTIKVDIASPQKKPEVQWLRNLMLKREGVEMIVDIVGSDLFMDI